MQNNDSNDQYASLRRQVAGILAYDIGTLIETKMGVRPGTVVPRFEVEELISKRLELEGWAEAAEQSGAIGKEPRQVVRSGAWVGDGSALGDREVAAVENVDGIMAPDYAIVRLRNGMRLLVGDEGVNVCASEDDMNEGIVCAGLTFQRQSAESPTDPSSATGSGRATP